MTLDFLQDSDIGDIHYVLFFKYFSILICFSIAYTLGSAKEGEILDLFLILRFFIIIYEEVIYSVFYLEDLSRASMKENKFRIENKVYQVIFNSFNNHTIYVVKNLLTS